ncbi:lasso peptide biosynthesis B2 protein [Anaeromicropila herbilytica]|uniref:Microcin J25-processing protein McjB C-terminal domain-containing protein n=1 Tax=Anaeromicropila herbilytica TaxID=2785025 RepID=A0A7R7EIF4_9FIRM|nr:lasso peptide biosynthesis B2 protein [Anaeromicropila herbilytica]BCN29027.1 hypothetical protein bsdtb5_03220 [Anaeromicropila herbilytica]
MIQVLDYIKFNNKKWLTIEVWFWAAIFRLLILFVPVKYMKKYYGIFGEESPYNESIENYGKAKIIAYHVNRIAEHTPWESRCLVRALTAQRLLTNKRITSTLYLGVRKEEDNMVAHAWIRTGEYYATGGNGDGYVVVAKFRK